MATAQTSAGSGWSREDVIVEVGTDDEITGVGHGNWTTSVIETIIDESLSKLVLGLADHPLSDATQAAVAEAEAHIFHNLDRRRSLIQNSSRE